MSVCGTAEGQAQKVLHKTAQEYRKYNSANGVGEIIAPLKSETGLAIKGPKNTKAPASIAAVQGSRKSCSSHNEFDLYRHSETW